MKFLCLTEDNNNRTILLNPSNVKYFQEAFNNRGECTEIKFAGDYDLLPIRVSEDIRKIEKLLN